MSRHALAVARMISDFRSPGAVVVDTLLAARDMRMPRVEPWWRWTVTLACSISCRRVENILAGRDQWSAP